MRIDGDKVARLTGRELGALNDALREAYPNRAALRRFLSYELDKSLDDYASDGGTREVVEVVLDTAKAEAWLADLVQAALDTSKNLALHEWARSYELSPAGAKQTDGSTPQATPLPDPSYQPTTKDQVKELAKVFNDPVSARHLLEAAGLAAGRHPYWGVSSAEAFWQEVRRLFENGAVLGGWPRLMKAALEDHEDNAVFRASVAAAS